eukprot:1443561-Pyramimonas_sp.AAC.1
MKWPSLLDLFQRATNVRGISEISELEGLLQMRSLYEIAVSNCMSTEVAWKHAVAESVKTEPFWGAWAGSLQKFCSKTTLDQLTEARD